MLRIQNDARARLGNPLLVWDDTLASYAQGWVDMIALNNARRAAGQPSAIPGSQGVHSDGSCYARANGNRPENITGGSAGYQRAVDLWIEEERHFNTSTRRCNDVCGHFLQTVHYLVTRVGCGWNANSSWACAYDTYGARITPDGSYADPFARNQH